MLTFGRMPLPLRQRSPGVSLPRILFYEFCLLANRALFACCYRLTVLHRERVPQTGPLLVASNHESFFDPSLVGTYARPRHVSFVARVGLFTSRPFAWLISCLNATPIKGDGNDTASIREIVRRLHLGHAVVIFPEGARAFDGSLQEFKRGISLLVKKGDADVLPVAVAGAFEVWPRSRKIPGKFWRRIGVAYGVPIPAADLLKDGPDAALNRLRDEIQKLRAELRAELKLPPRP